MSYIKLSSTTSSGAKCIRFDTQYTHCEVPTSRFDKLQHMIGLYDTINSITLVIDCPLNEWKITKPLGSIKHLNLDARTKFSNRPGVLPENIWLMFPNLETLITTNVFLPVDNLDTLQNLNTFRLTWGASKIKKYDTRIQEIVQFLANMTSLIDIQIIPEQECHIPDELFQNNQGLKYIDFSRKAISNNIPSILNCRELVRMHIKININDNPYILELSGLEQAVLRDHFTTTPFPDEVFAKPVFTTCTEKANIDVYDLTLINKSGDNLRKLIEKNKKGYIPSRKIADGNFMISSYYHD